MYAGETKRQKLVELLEASIEGRSRAKIAHGIVQSSIMHLDEQGAEEMVEVAFDRSVGLRIREEALLWLKDHPGVWIVEAADNYYRGCLREPNQPCELSRLVFASSAAYYRQSGDISARWGFTSRC